jgi:protein ImuB
VGMRANAQVLIALNPEAEAAGLRQGQALRDASAMCPGLLTRSETPAADEAFLRALRRWAGKFSPWVAEEAPDALVVDLTGCAHLFGGETGLMAQVEEDCADLGLSLRAAIADTRGAAWALARYAGTQIQHGRNGDAIKQEARATRSHAADRRIGPAPVPGRLNGVAGNGAGGVIALPGQMRQALANLPLAALRLTPQAVEALGRLGLRRVEDIMGLPRAALARRFGSDVLKRLDQALGVDPEPVNPAGAPRHFAVRLSFPDPIGLRSDVASGIERLLIPLCDRLRAQSRGARRVRLEAQRVDAQVQMIEVGLARASYDPDRIRPLLLLKLDDLEAGFGIDRLRLEAFETEPLHALQHRGHLEAAADVSLRQGSDTALEDVISKLGTRLGQDSVIRLHPAESNIPEKSATVLSAAWSEPAPAPWPRPRAPRPIQIFHPEPIDAGAEAMLPSQFRWRRRDLSLRFAVGPERLLPEWWLDDPQWRSGPRDYWRVELLGGLRLWLYHAHGAEIPGGWFCHGEFA